MSLYVYALADEPPAIDDLRGLEGERLEVAQLTGAVAILGHAEDVPAPTRGRLEAQDRLIRTLHDRAGSLLPVRFGTTVASVAALEEHPTLQAAVIGPALAAARGREQMTVRVATSRPVAAELQAAAAPPDRHAAGAGRQYLEARAAASAPPAEIRELLAAVAALVRAERIERGRVPGMLATVYHLIDRGRGDDYRAAMDARRGFLPALSLSITGPAPAYAFGPGEWTTHG